MSDSKEKDKKSKDPKEKVSKDKGPEPARVEVDDNPEDPDA